MISKHMRIMIRMHTDTLPPEPELIYNSDDESYSDSEVSDSLTLDELAREPPLLSNMTMPIFDIETQTMDLALPQPEQPEEEPDIVNTLDRSAKLGWQGIVGILDRTDRLGCYMPLGKKNVAVTIKNDELIVGKWWGEFTVIPFEPIKQRETLMQICKAYNLLASDMRNTDRENEKLTERKLMLQKFISLLENTIDDACLEEYMGCFQAMIDRAEAIDLIRSLQERLRYLQDITEMQSTPDSTSSMSPATSLQSSSPPVLRAPEQLRGQDSPYDLASRSLRGQDFSHDLASRSLRGQDPSHVLTSRSTSTSCTGLTSSEKEHCTSLPFHMPMGISIAPVKYAESVNKLIELSAKREILPQ